MFLPAFRCLGAVVIVDKNLKCCLTINESKTARDIAVCFFLYLEMNMHHHRDRAYVHFRSLLLRLLGELCENTELTIDEFSSSGAESDDRSIVLNSPDRSRIRAFASEPFGNGRTHRRTRNEGKRSSLIVSIGKRTRQMSCKVVDRGIPRLEIYSIVFFYCNGETNKENE